MEFSCTNSGHMQSLLGTSWYSVCVSLLALCGAGKLFSYCRVVQNNHGDGILHAEAACIYMQL